MTTAKSNVSAGPIVLAVGGMTCGGCAGAVGRALSGVPGVVEAQVDLGNGRATVTGTAGADDLIRAVTDAGFSAEPT
ncbi:MAG: heavy-metal-associated domain-containing protein [Steroidobacteraceae bacterium]